MAAEIQTEQAFEPDAYRTLNAICDEFRRRIKCSLVELDVDVTVDAVVNASHLLSSSDWLEGFRANERTNKAA